MALIQLRQIAFFNLVPEASNFFEARFPKVLCRGYSGVLSSVTRKRLKDSEVLCVFVNSKVDGKLLDCFSRLQLVCGMGTGWRRHLSLLNKSHK